MRQRIARVKDLSTEEAGGEQSRKSRLGAMQLHLEQLKIHADINDPLVKRKFEDGQGMFDKASTFGILGNWC
jgi:large subunit ribosomal protein L35